MPIKRKSKKVRPSDIRAIKIFPRKNEKVISATQVNERGAVITFQKKRRK